MIGKTPGLSWMTPALSVNDLGVSLRCYRDVLGFEKRWQWSEAGSFDGDEQPAFASVARGEHAIFPCEQGQGQPGAWICLNVRTLADLEALHREYVGSGARVVDPPQSRSWGMREMTVQDPDGNTFRMGATLPARG